MQHAFVAPRGYVVDLHLRVEDKVFGRAGVLAVVHGRVFQLGKGGIQDLHGVVQGFVHGQRAWDLELLDDNLVRRISKTEHLKNDLAENTRNEEGFRKFRTHHDQEEHHTEQRQPTCVTKVTCGRK